MKLPRPPLVEEKLLAVVDGEWRTAREIYAIFDEGSQNTVRHALRSLVGAGKVERYYSPLPTGEVARYRKLAGVAEPG